MNSKERNINLSENLTEVSKKIDTVVEACGEYLKIYKEKIEPALLSDMKDLSESDWKLLHEQVKEKIGETNDENIKYSLTIGFNSMVAAISTDPERIFSRKEYEKINYSQFLIQDEHNQAIRCGRPTEKFTNFGK